MSAGVVTPVYLDYHATTPVDPRVFEAMRPWLEGGAAGLFGNPASRQHAFGERASRAVETARGQVAALVGVEPDEVIFTSGATESINLAIKGMFLPRGPGRAQGRLVTSVVEHRATLDPAKRLMRQGVDVVWLRVDPLGHVSLSDLVQAVEDGTRLVSLLLANNEIGTIASAREISEVCRRVGVALHWDASQAAGHVASGEPAWGGDLVSLSAHKLCGPQGIGALVVRKREPSLRLTPLIEGGGHEQHLRSGTVPVALAVGFGVAAELARRERVMESRRLAELRDRLWRRLRAGLGCGEGTAGQASSGTSSRGSGTPVNSSGPLVNSSTSVPDDRLILRNGDPDRALPGNLNISVGGVDGDRLLAALTEIAVSSGAACSSSNPEPSHVLRAIGRSEALAKASLRFGLGRFTTEAEVDFAADAVIRTVQRLRSA